MSGTPDVSPPPEGVNSSLNKDQPASSSSSTTAASSSGASAVVVAPPTSGAAVSSDQTEAAADENAMSDAPTVTATYTIKVSGSAPLSVGAPATCVKVIDLKNLIAEKDQRFPVAVQKLVFKGKVLADDDVLADKKIASGATIFLVKGVVAAAGAETAAAASTDGVKCEAAKDEKSADPIRCAGGCGFWGNPKTENYCSKCFKDKQEKDQAEIIKKQTEAEEAEKKKVVTDEKVAAGEGDKSEEKKERPVQENKTRCWICNKKCGLAGIECRCGYVFCSAHRLPEDHNCDFDYKATGREILRKQNNKVEADKLEDRL